MSPCAKYNTLTKKTIRSCYPSGFTTVQQKKRILANGAKKSEEKTKIQK